MAKIVKGARFISKISNSSGVIPTIPANEDHTTGWRDTDIYIGEWFFNTADSKIYFRTQNGIHEIITENNGKIDANYLPGNYLGAMVYQGVWNASAYLSNDNSTRPGVDIKPTPEKGDYYIVSGGGSADLNVSGSFVEYNTGDFVIYAGINTGWQKVDNSEPVINSINVIYTNSGITQLENTTVSAALDKIINDKFLFPYFDKTVNINKENDISTNQLLRLNGNNITGTTLLEINGNSTNKWLSYNGTTLNIGSYTNDSIIQFGPKGLINLSLSSTSNFTYSDTNLNNYKRWSIYSSSSDGYIKGYSNDGVTSKISLSLNGYSYINSGGLVIGDLSLVSGSVLQVNTGDTVSKLIISRGGSNIGTNTTSGVLSFYQNLDGTQTEYGNISLRTSTDFNYQTTIGFKIKSGLGGLLNEGLTLEGNNNGIYVGINNITPEYELDVFGSTNISDSLYVNTDISITGNTLYVGQNGSIEFTGNNNVAMSFQNMMKVWWMSTNDLVIYGEIGFPLLTLNSTSGLLTLGGQIKTPTSATTIYNMNQDVRMDSDVSFNKVTLNEKIVYADINVVIDDSKDVPNKKYVDDQINSHSNYGIWTTGFTNDINETDVVLYNGSMVYYTGININNPTYNLHVVGNSLITSDLTMGGDLLLNSKSDISIIDGSDVYFKVNSIVPNSIFIGNGAGIGATVSEYSTLIGYNAGQSFMGNDIGTNNIIIGTNISLPDGVSNSINIGGVLFGSGTNQVSITDPNINAVSGKIGINVVIPTATLDITDNDDNDGSYLALRLQKGSSFGYTTFEQFSFGGSGDDYGLNINYDQLVINKGTSNVSIGTNSSTSKFSVLGTGNSGTGTTYTVASFYNSYEYGVSNKGETLIVLGKTSGTTNQDMGGIGSYPTNSEYSTGGTISLYNRTNDVLVERLTIDSSGTLKLINNSLVTFQVNSVAINSTFIGMGAGIESQLSSNSVFVGQNSGRFSNSTYSNYIGYNTGQNSTLSTNCNYFGLDAGKTSTSISYSNFIGTNVGTSSNNSSYSNYIGYFTGNASISSSYSNFIGYAAGRSASGVSYSTLIGYNVGRTFTNNNIGTNNIIIGTNISLPNATSNAINIGGVLFGSGTNSFRPGNPRTTPITNGGKIGINVVIPTATLEISDNSNNYGSFDVLKLSKGTTFGNTLFTQYYFGSDDFGLKINNNQLVINSGNTTVSINSNLNITGNTFMYGNLDVTGISTLGTTNLSTLGVSGNVNLSSTLNVTGDTILSSLNAGTTTLNSLSVTNNTSLNTLGVSSTVTLSSTLNVNGLTTLSGNVNISGAAALSTTLIVTGNTSLNSDLDVDGTTTLNILNAGVTSLNSLSVINNSIFDGNVLIKNGLNLNNTAFITTVGQELSYINFGHNGTINGQAKISIQRYGTIDGGVGNSLGTSMYFYNTYTTGGGTSGVTTDMIVNKNGVTIGAGLSVIGAGATFNHGLTIPNGNAYMTVNYAKGNISGASNVNGYIPAVKAFGSCDSDGNLKAGSFGVSGVTNNSGDYTITCLFDVSSCIILSTGTSTASSPHRFTKVINKSGNTFHVIGVSDRGDKSSTDFDFVVIGL